VEEAALYLYMRPAPERFKCSDSNLTSSQQRVCDKNFKMYVKRNREESLGKLPMIP